jgi:ornithine cyclodeaminase/alanine dehydrogenase-like protein (mu-crystallin family)
MISSGPVFVSASAVESVLGMKDAIDVVARAYRVPLAGAASPPRLLARGEGVWLRALAAIPPSARLMGTKVFGLGTGRTVNYLISLFDQRSAELVALVDGCHITAVRTAATSAVAIDHMAPNTISVGAVLGSGLEAQTHLRALACIRQMKEVRIFSPNRANREAFAAAARIEHGIEAIAVESAEMAARGAEIVIAAARSHGEKPILHGEWLDDQCLVVSIGSTLPEQREVDVSVVAAADLIVCDNVDEVADQAGDMIAARTAGIDFRFKLMSLNELVLGFAAPTGAKRRMFKSVGSAVQDIVVADWVVERARTAGMVTPLNLSLHTKRV